MQWVNFPWIFNQIPISAGSHWFRVIAAAVDDDGDAVDGDGDGEWYRRP